MKASRFGGLRCCWTLGRGLHAVNRGLPWLMVDRGELGNWQVAWVSGGGFGGRLNGEEMKLWWRKKQAKGMLS